MGKRRQAIALQSARRAAAPPGGTGRTLRGMGSSDLTAWFPCLEPESFCKTGKVVCCVQQATRPILQPWVLALAIPNQPQMPFAGPYPLERDEVGILDPGAPSLSLCPPPHLASSHRSLHHTHLWQRATGTPSHLGTAWGDQIWNLRESYVTMTKHGRQT